MKRGFYGLAVYHPKNTLNIGTLWRTAHLLGASFLCTIGRRYKGQPSDTLKSTRHVPLFHALTFDEFRERLLPDACQIVAIELAEKAVELKDFTHPERAVYMLGAEDHGIPPDVLARCHHVVRLRGERSMNMSVAGSIVAYHREAL